MSNANFRVVPFVKRLMFVLLVEMIIASPMGYAYTAQSPAVDSAQLIIIVLLVKVLYK